jgi:hypothetical protein
VSQKQGSKNLFSRRRFLLQFAPSSLKVREVLAGAAPAERCQIGNPGLPEKACTPVVLWAFVSLPDAAALKGSKNASRKAARVGKESFSSWPWCAKKQLATGLVFLASCIDTES